MNDFIKQFASRSLQDFITAFAGYLAAHGFLAADQTQGFIGSAFFISMLFVNYGIGEYRKAHAAQDGGMAVAAVTNDIPTSAPVVASIIAQAKAAK
jgi:hypothetical protein